MSECEFRANKQGSDTNGKAVELQQQSETIDYKTVATNLLKDTEVGADTQTPAEEGLRRSNRTRTLTE